MELAGVFPPLTTPFENDRIAPQRLGENIARYEGHGVAGYVLLGSTGETAYLDEDEKVELIRAARAAVPAPKTLVVGAGLESTRASCRMVRVAADHGADAALVVTPHYFRSRMGEEELVRHYLAVADASPVPVLLYNVPKFTSVVIPVAAVERLAQHPNVAGLKDSSGDIGWMIEVLARVPAPFRVLCGAPGAFLPALEAGATGGILAIADPLPEPFVRLFEAQRGGDAATARATQRSVVGISRLLVGTMGVAGVKAAMDERGLFGGDPRPPLLPLDAAARARVRSALAELLDDGVLDRPEL
jgi:4-hydroxy-2-oxoglutarate aldolase